MFHTKSCIHHDTILILISEITKNGYNRSSNNHFRVQLKSSTRTPPGRPLIGRTTVVPGSGSEQSGCTRCAELMFRSTRYWLPLYPELVRSVQATRRRAHTRTRARVHTRRTLRIRISVARQIFRYFRTHDQPSGYGAPSAHTTNPQDTDLRRTSNIPIFYNNNAAHFAARRILCENAPYVCMSYPASSTNISTAAAHFRSSQKQRTSPRLHRISQRQHTTNPQDSIGSAGALLDTSRLSAIHTG